MESLTAKYRPRTLTEILGQEHVVAPLRSFVSAPYPAAFLFHGESGLGKTATAFALANDLGCAVAEKELGGLLEVASGCQTTDSVKKFLDLLRYRPLYGSGWKVGIVNESDRMALPVESVWLDALEHLPPRSVVIFTTNDPGRLSRRFRDRCECHEFQHDAAVLGPWIRALCKHVWRQEGCPGDPPHLDRLGMPTLTGRGEDLFCSFRLALQQLQPLIRAAVTPS
jgi:replication-associated recombination protein RarA